MKIYTDADTHVKIKAGVDKLADIVKTTLGPKGKNVIIYNPGDISIINDGATIAKAIEFVDPIENAGALLAKQCADKTNIEAGDGTTTTIVLLQAYLREMSKLPEYIEPRKVREAIQNELDTIVIPRIDEMKRPLEEGENYKIAFNSSLDEEIAKAVAEVVTEDGVTDIEELDKFGIETEKVNGLRIDDGLMFQHFATSTDSTTAEMTDCYVLLTNKDITTVKDLAELMDKLIKKNITKLAIFCASIEKEVVGFLVANKMQGIFQTLLVKTRDMDDIALLTGATIVTDELGTNYSEEILGKCGKIIATPYYTIVSDGVATQEAIEARISEYAEKRQKEKTFYLEKMIARLKGGVSIIRIGGHNVQSTKERKLKLEDAVNATKAAMAEGVVVGGGQCLMEIAEIVISELLHNVLQAPREQLLANADNMAINITPDVIDPAKVIKSALKNAIATGNMILTAQNGIYYKEDDKK